MNLEQAINQIYDLKNEWECEGLLTKLNQTDINAMGIIISNLEDLQQRIDKAIEYVEENTVYFSELHKVGNYFVNCKSDELLKILKGDSDV